MVTKTKVIKRVSYYITVKEAEKIYSILNKMNLNPSRYAQMKNVSASTFSRILTGDCPLTKNMYLKAFKFFKCLNDVPSEFETILDDTLEN